MQQSISTRIIHWLNRNEYIVKRYSVFLNRFFIIRRWLFKNIHRFSNYIQWNVLDFWCWYKPYKEIFRKVTHYHWVDFSGTKDLYNSADAYYNWEKLQYADNYFDSLICTEVLEHVFNIDIVLSELYRVLKIWANWIITIPFAWDEHEQPHDFWRYTYFGIQAILHRHKFKILHHIKSGNYIDTLWQLFIMYYIKISFSKFNIVNLLNRFTLIPIMNVVFFTLWRILPKNYDLYLNHIIVIEKT